MMKFLLATWRFRDDTTSLGHGDPSADLTLLLLDSFARIRIAIWGIFSWDKYIFHPRPWLPIPCSLQIPDVLKGIQGLIV